MGCMLCKIVSSPNNSALIAEDPFAICILDDRPIVRGHVLLIPKRHVPSAFDLSEQEYMHIMRTVRKVALGLKMAYNPAIVAVFIAGYQIRDHEHIHFLPLNAGIADILTNTRLRDRELWTKESLDAEAVNIRAQLNSMSQNGHQRELI